MTSHAAARRVPRRRPVSRSRARGGSQINWERFGRVILVIVLFAVLASYLRPVTGLLHAWQDSKSSKETLTQLQDENAQLQREAAADSTNAVLIREARKLGYVRTGERAFVVDGLPSQ